MNILIVADSPLENPVSGLEQVLYQQASGLRNAGHCVYAIIRKDDRRAAPIVKDVTGLKIGSYMAPTKNMVSFFISLFIGPLKLYNRFVMELRFDVVLAHQALSLLPLILAGRLNRVPIIYILHSPWHEEYQLANTHKQSPTFDLAARVRRIFEKFCLKKAAFIITLSRYMRGKICSMHSIPEDKTSICPGGVDLTRFQPRSDRVALKARLDFPPGKLHLLTVRNLEPRMGLDNLIKSMAILKKEPDLKLNLVIGGTGPERGPLERLILGHGLSDTVQMTGFIPSADLPLYYEAADFFVLPTRELEGFGLVTLESMACGTPVLGTPVGGTHEILSGVNSEFLFKDTSPEAIADGIQHAINMYYHNKSKYKSLRQQCRKYVERRYSWDRHVGQLRDIISEVVSQETEN